MARRWNWASWWGRGVFQWRLDFSDADRFGLLWRVVEIKQGNISAFTLSDLKGHRD
jgi:hypothetical protein